jgi:hypothetical protein
VSRPAADDRVRANAAVRRLAALSEVRPHGRRTPPARLSRAAARINSSEAAPVADTATRDVAPGTTVPAVLAAPDWLVELAARDDPPTVIENELLARFRSAGVDELVPTDGTESLPVEDAAQATGIGALGPGFAFGESFEDEPAPLAGALVRLRDQVEGFDLLRRFRLAAIDMRLVEDTARALADRNGPARLFERVLETGLVVTYARPYLSKGAGGVGYKWRPTDEADRLLHRRLIDERWHPYHAHADRTPRRTLTDTAAMLGIEGPPNYAEAWWRLTDTELAAIADLARRQRERFEKAAHDAGAELGEQRPDPTEKWSLGEPDRD